MNTSVIFISFLLSGLERSGGRTGTNAPMPPRIVLKLTSSRVSEGHWFVKIKTKDTRFEHQQYMEVLRYVW
jgi:hypothetical protein